MPVSSPAADGRLARASVLVLVLGLSACDGTPPPTSDGGRGDGGPLPTACGAVTDVDLALGPLRITGMLDQPHESIELREGCGVLEGLVAVDVVAGPPPPGGGLVGTFTLVNEVTPSSLDAVVEVRGACTDRLDGVCHDDTNPIELRPSGGFAIAPGGTAHLVIAAPATTTAPYAIDLDVRARTQPVITAASVLRHGGGRRISVAVEGTDEGGDAVGVRATMVSDTGATVEPVLPIDRTAAVMMSRDWDLPYVANEWSSASEVTFRIVDETGDASDPVTVAVVDATNEGALGDPCDRTRTCGIGLDCEGGACALTPEAQALCDAAETLVLDPASPTVRTGIVPGFYGALYPACVAGVGGEVVFRVVVPAEGRCDLIASTDRLETEEYADTTLWLATACGDPSTEIASACDDDGGERFLTSRLEHRDVAAGSTLVLGVDRVHERDVGREYGLEISLRPVRSPGESCDDAGVADRCAGAACTDGNCP